ncbi:Hypothetical predicted protein [Mytilus galloprovincialis]|uniref:Uncharacterized protein n=1 Tax=Mytilus galloprovincialis TaxID=29158 RepID=A0A8B6BX15_MYTGA|nr:Hypothetical predicted protein [Mytilus galloprovincialis]
MAQVHKRTQTASNEVDLLDGCSLIEDNDNVKCLKHPPLVCDFYCMRDRCFVCTECIKFTHQPAICNIEHIEILHLSKRNQLIAEVHTDDGFEDVLTELQIIETEKTNEELRNQKLKSSVEEYKDKWINHLDEQSQNTLKELEKERKKFEKDCEDTKTLLTEQKSKLKRLEGDLSDILLSDDIDLILRKIEEANECVNEPLRCPDNIQISILENSSMDLFTRLNNMQHSTI